MQPAITSFFEFGLATAGASTLTLGQKMKSLLIFACVTLGILAIGLLPHATHTTSAYPENLWTSGGQFGEPSKTEAILRWNRTEYGVIWAWLVHDSSTTESAWYARIEPRYFVLYAGGAFIGGLVSIFLVRPRKEQPNKS